MSRVWQSVSEGPHTSNMECSRPRRNHRQAGLSRYLDEGVGKSMTCIWTRIKMEMEDGEGRHGVNDGDLLGVGLHQASWLASRG